MCDSADCSECDVPAGYCIVPPPPPSPNPRPPTLCTPSWPGALNCVEHGGCCEDETLGCYRKFGSGHAGYGRCQTEEACQARDGWSCELVVHEPPTPPPPPWEGPACGLDYESCWDPPYCCRGPTSGCHRRAGRQFAMCKPLRCSGDTCTCVEDGVWLCPGWEKLFPPAYPAMSPSPLPPPPSPLPSLPSPPVAPLPAPSPPIPSPSGEDASQPSVAVAVPLGPALGGCFAAAVVLLGCSMLVVRCARMRKRARRGVELRDAPEPSEATESRAGSKLKLKTTRPTPRPGSIGMCRRTRLPSDEDAHAGLEDEPSAGSAPAGSTAAADLGLD